MSEALRPVTFRLPLDLVERVAAFGRRRAAEEPGLELPTTAWVRVLLERGLRADPLPTEAETDTKQFAFRLPDELLQRVRAYGERVGLSPAGAVRVLVEAGLHMDVPSRRKVQR